jgi:muramoyltetrapeptide carboxypeptidase
MNHLLHICPGSIFTITAPARKVTREEMAPGIALLESWGFKVKLSKNLFGEFNQYSGTDEERAADFQAALDDPESDAIIVARGGYGCVRIIDRLDFSTFTRRPKLIIGFSDVTVFHNHVHAHFGVPTLHAPMIFSMQPDKSTPEALESMRKILKEENVQYNVSAHPLNRNGIAEGILVGGNLSLLYALSGSPSDIDTNGKILFIEDLDEYLYHIDRMMMQLKRSGKLAGLRGLIVGGMSDMRDNAIPFGKIAEEIIAEAVSEYDFPVCMNFPAGHIQNNQPLVMGGRVSMEVGETSIVEIKTS